MIIFSIAILAIVTFLVYDYNRQLFNAICANIVMFLIMTIFALALLKGCMAEQDLQEAKAAQWAYEREHGLPYTSFNE